MPITVTRVLQTVAGRMIFAQPRGDAADAGPMASPVPFAAILVAAGRSSRMGSDKLWADVWGRPTWRWSLDALLATPGLTRVAIAVAAPTRWTDFARRFLPTQPTAAWSSRVVRCAPTRSSPGCGP